jgi:hypothetical protein
MKKIIYMLLGLAFMASCAQDRSTRYASASPEIDIMKSLAKAYVDQNWEAFRTHYADTAKINYNSTKGNEISVEAAIRQHKEDHVMFSDIHYVTDEDFYEMVVTDDGETWVNFWGVWVGTLKSTDQKFEIPVHLTSRFINAKVVAEHGYWNNSDIVRAILESERSN